jgi:hypothetical protein
MMTVKNGLYSIRIEMKDGGRGRATGVIVLLDGQILGGDTHFYYAFAGREPAGLQGPIPMEKQRSTEPRWSGKTAFRFMPS